MGVFSYLAKLFQRSEPEVVLVSKPLPLPKKETIEKLRPVKLAADREQVEAERERNSWSSIEQLDGVLRYYSGYFRQAAVERCEELRLPGTLPLVALRLNDWVPEVRRAARKAVLAMLAGASLEDQFAVLPIVGTLHNAGRTDHGKWILEFELRFVAVVGTDALWDGFVHGQQKQARICFDLLRKHSGLPLVQLLARGVASKRDIVLATQSVEFATQLESSERSPVLMDAMTSHFGSVRKTALQALLAEDADARLVKHCLLDKHASVRALAIKYLEHQQFDVKEYYRGLLHSPSVKPAQLRIALLSLAFLASAEDLAAIKSKTDVENPGVRSAAYSSWFRLAPSEKDALVLQVFADGAPSIRKFGRFLLERHGAYATFPELARVLGPSEELLQLMFTVRSHKWNWLEAIVLIARETRSDSHLASALVIELRSWISNAKWSRHRPIGNQAIELSDHTAVLSIEALILGENDEIAQLREQMAQLAAI